MLVEAAGLPEALLRSVSAEPAVVVMATGIHPAQLLLALPILVAVAVAEVLMVEAHLFLELEQPVVLV
jgi:hypothetical protein